MAMIDLAPRRMFGAPTFPETRAVFTRATENLRARLRAARTLRELERLSPALRADIGLLDADLDDLRAKALY